VEEEGGYINPKKNSARDGNEKKIEGEEEREEEIGHENPVELLSTLKVV
jgi:hypothetical protein